MRKKLTLNRGIAGLALSAFVFMGCQDLLSEDKPVQTAKPPSEEIQVAAQEAAAQSNATTEPAKDLPVKADTTTEPAKDMPAKADATTEPAKDLPATAVETPKPVTSEPASTPAVPDNAGECKDIYAQMQSALKTPNDPLYMELKNKFGSLNCDITQFSTPTVPTVIDSATVCKNYKASLADMDPNSSKYPLYLEQIAIYCTDAKTTAVPAETPKTPAAPASPATPANASECQDIYNQMQTAKDPLYGELKNKFGSLNCDHSKIVIPVIPNTPDIATVCKNLRSTFATLDPSSPKYAGYQNEIATHCAANP